MAHTCERCGIPADETEMGTLALSREPDLADDLLSGAPAIAQFLGSGFTPRMVYYMAEKGSIPAFRLPGTSKLRARKSELRRSLSALAILNA